MDGDVRKLTTRINAVTTEELDAKSTVIVVGASLAGWRAVETLRTDGYEGTITLVGAEEHLPYDRPPLSDRIAHVLSCSICASRLAPITLDSP